MLTSATGANPCWCTVRASSVTGAFATPAATPLIVTGCP